MKVYKSAVNHILVNGSMTAPTRTGSCTLIAHPLQMSHDLADGFPILTTRKINFNAIAAELSGYLQGITDKKWYQDNGCSFWNEWANRDAVKAKQKELNDFSEETRKQIQSEERDIFSGYGWEWLHYGVPYVGYNWDYRGHGINQVRKVVDTLKKSPLDRRALVFGWNVENEESYAIPPCVYVYQFYSHDGKRLHMAYNQRSCDMALGGANDFPSGALLLTLVARAVNMEPGVLTACITIPHIYEAHIVKLSEQMLRPEYPLPALELADGMDCFNFDHEKARLLNYVHHKSISFDRSV